MECRNCGHQFARLQVINGQRKDLSKRKYCLDCSPFGSHNTQRLQEALATGTARTCQRCGRQYRYNPATGNSSMTCGSCYSNRSRAGRKIRAVAFLGGCCVICGYDRCMAALDFHHRDASTKAFSLSVAWSRRWEIIEAELRKCVLICRNCHSELHSGLITLAMAV